MIHFFINAGSASAGGGLTYLRNLVAQLAERDDVRATVLLSRQGQDILRGDSLRRVPSHIAFISRGREGSALSRFWREQFQLPGIIRSTGAHVLLSIGNVALRNSPVPQLLLSRNSLYTCPHFFRDLWTRHEHRRWITEKCKSTIAKRSIRWADCTIAPSAAFASELEARTGEKVIPLHHGFDSTSFFATTKMPSELQKKLDDGKGCARLLFVSHYNYYRNFETLLRALPLIRRELAPTAVRLYLTCNLRSGDNPGNYRTGSAAALVRELKIENEVVELGPVPYELLHHVYKSSDLYITPAYAESFAHPLVEAMACGLPIVASDLPVHREICGEAAVYASKFCPQEFAYNVVNLIKSPGRRAQLAAAGRSRAQAFSWSNHWNEIVQLGQKLLSDRVRNPEVSANNENSAWASS